MTTYEVREVNQTMYIVDMQCMLYMYAFLCHFTYSHNTDVCLFQLLVLYKSVQLQLVSS